MKSSLFTHVHSSPLSLASGYINVAQTVLVILTMAGLFPDRPHIIYSSVCWMLSIAPGPFSSFLHPVLSQKSDLYGLYQVGSLALWDGPEENTSKDKRQKETEVGAFSLLSSLLDHGEDSGRPQLLFRGTVLNLHVSPGSDDHPLPLHLFPTVASPYHPLTVSLKLANTFLNKPLLQPLFKNPLSQLEPCP